MTDENKNEPANPYAWLQNLKAGDLVILVERAVWKSIARCEGATAQRVCVSSRNYRRKDGREVGADDWDWTSIEEATPELVARLRARDRKNNLARRLKDAAWDKLDYETLQKVLALAESVVPEKPELYPEV